MSINNKVYQTETKFKDEQPGRDECTSAELAQKFGVTIRQISKVLSKHGLVGRKITDDRWLYFPRDPAETVVAEFARRQP